MVAKSNKYLGNGWYTVAEAAMYCRVPKGTMTRWLFGTKSGNSVIDPEFGTKERFVSFMDLVQTLAIRDIRAKTAVPLDNIRQAIRHAKDEWELDHPFARHHCTYVYGDTIVIRPKEDKDLYIEASGKHKGQPMLPYVELYMTALDFSPVDGLANRYRIFTSTHKRPITITMDPRVRFGEPLLPSGHTALSILHAYHAEGGINQAADAYGIPPEEVDASRQFEVYLNLNQNQKKAA